MDGGATEKDNVHAVILARQRPQKIDKLLANTAAPYTMAWQRKRVMKKRKTKPRNAQRYCKYEGFFEVSTDDSLRVISFSTPPGIS